MTPTLNEIIATHNSVRLEKSAREAMIAVIKTHIVPMLADGFYEGTGVGFYCESRHSDKECGCGAKRDTYAERVEREIMGDAK